MVSLGLKRLNEEIIVAAIDVRPRVLARQRSDRANWTIDALSFGFLGKPGRTGAGPTKLVLNGVPVTLSPEVPAPSATASFSVTGQSKRGLTASITIANMGAVPIGGRALQFKFPPRISLMDGAAIVRHSCAIYVIGNAGYNGVIEPGKSVSFQLRGTGRKYRSGPVDYSLDGVSISGNTIL